MSEDNLRKNALFILLILLAFGSAGGLVFSIVVLIVAGSMGFVAGIVASVLGFIGAIFGIFMIIRKRRTEQIPREKITSETRMWIIIAILSPPAALVTLLLSFLSFQLAWLFFIITALFAGLFIYSLFVLFSGRSQIRSTPTEANIPNGTELKEDQ